MKYSSWTNCCLAVGNPFLLLHLLSEVSGPNRFSKIDKPFPVTFDKQMLRRISVSYIWVSVPGASRFLLLVVSLVNQSCVLCSPPLDILSIKWSDKVLAHAGPPPWTCHLVQAVPAWPCVPMYGWWHYAKGHPVRQTSLWQEICWPSPTALEMCLQEWYEISGQ